MGPGLSQINIHRRDICYLVADMRLLVAAKMRCWFHAALIACGALISISPAMAQSRLAEFATRATPQEFFSKATRFGVAQGDPPLLPVYAGDALLGFVYLNSDFTGAVGYSGKPVHILVGIDTQGTLIRFKLVDHKEPIVLVGVPERRVVEALNTLIGARMGLVASGTERAPQPDIVSGATVTVLVMADSVVRSAVRLMKSGRISPGGIAAASGAPEAETKSLDMSQAEKRDWQSLLGDGSVRRLKLNVADVNTGIRKIQQKRGCRFIPSLAIPTIHSSTSMSRWRAPPSSAGAFSVSPVTSSCARA